MTATVIQRTITTEVVIPLDEPTEEAPRGYVVVPRCRINACDHAAAGGSGICRMHYQQRIRGTLREDAVA